MGKNRALPPAAIELVARRFKILGEPLRLRLLQVLQDGEMTVSALAKAMESTQPNVSKHLKILLDGGLVKRRARGNTAWFSIADPSIEHLCSIVCESLGEQLARQADSLAPAAARKPRA